MECKRAEMRYLDDYGLATVYLVDLDWDQEDWVKGCDIGWLEKEHATIPALGEALVSPRASRKWKYPF